MPVAVKDPSGREARVSVRRYESPLRKARAVATRRAILTAAEELFGAFGYADVSVQDVAAEAGVGARTVFKVFESKGILLPEAVVTAITGGEGDVSVGTPDFAGSLPAFQAVATGEDGATLLAGLASFAASVHRRSGHLAEVTRQAAALDPVVAEFWRWGRAQQAADLAPLMRLMRRRGWLRRGSSFARATDAAWVLTGHETYQQLVVERGWTLARYVSWLTEQLTASLLDLPARSGP
jgi:AcrR family transcriptional regulator